MNFARRTATAGIAAAALAGGALALAPTAGAAGPVVTSARPALGAVAVPAATAVPAGTVAPYNGVCGTGYRVVNSAEIGVTGTVYLTYNSAKGDNCVVTIRNNAGTAVPMVAELAITSTGQRVIDRGNYTSYAGPIHLHAAGYCVNWYGTISGVSAGKIGTNCAARVRG